MTNQEGWSLVSNLSVRITGVSVSKYNSCLGAKNSLDPQLEDLQICLQLSSCKKCLHAINKKGLSWKQRDSVFRKSKFKCNCFRTAKLKPSLFITLKSGSNQVKYVMQSINIYIYEINIRVFMNPLPLDQERKPSIKSKITKYNLISYICSSDQSSSGWLLLWP